MRATSSLPVVPADIVPRVSTFFPCSLSRSSVMSTTEMREYSRLDPWPLRPMTSYVPSSFRRIVRPSLVSTTSAVAVTLAPNISAVNTSVNSQAITPPLYHFRNSIPAVGRYSRHCLEAPRDHRVLCTCPHDPRISRSLVNHPTQFLCPSRRSALDAPLVPSHYFAPTNRDVHCLPTSTYMPSSPASGPVASCDSSRFVGKDNATRSSNSLPVPRLP